MSGAAEYIEFLKRAFNAVELSRSALPDGRLLNASIRVGDSVLMLNDVFPEFGGETYRSGRVLRLTLYLPDADAADAATRGACASHGQFQHQPLLENSGRTARR